MPSMVRTSFCHIAQSFARVVEELCRVVKCVCDCWPTPSKDLSLFYIYFLCYFDFSDWVHAQQGLKTALTFWNVLCIGKIIRALSYARRQKR